MLRLRKPLISLAAVAAMSACTDSGGEPSAPAPASASLTAGSIGTIVLQTPSGSSGVAVAAARTQYVFASLTPAGSNASNEFDVWGSPFGAPLVTISGSPCCAHDANLGGDVAGGGGVWLHAGGTWTFTPLSTGSYAQASSQGINDAREIVGILLSLSGKPPAYWSDPTAAPVLLPLPPTSGTPAFAYAMAINNDGQIVGYVNESVTSGRTTTTRNRAIVWTRSGTTWSAALLPDDGITSVASDINDAGQIAGATGAGLAIWTPNGSAYSSTVIATGVSFPRIDACGRVASYRSVNGNKREAYVVENGTLTVLPKPAASTRAENIGRDPVTGQGVIVGSFQGASSPWTPVVWTLPAC